MTVAPSAASASQIGPASPIAPVSQARPCPLPCRHLLSPKSRFMTAAYRRADCSTVESAHLRIARLAQVAVVLPPALA